MLFDDVKHLYRVFKPNLNVLPSTNEGAFYFAKFEVNTVQIKINNIYTTTK